MLKRGFTLVEIMVAVTVIAIIAAVVLANQGEGRDQARAATLLQQLQEIEKSMKLYLVSNDRTAWPSYAAPEQVTNLISASPPTGFAGFDRYLSSAPTPQMGSVFAYDSTAPTYTCSGSTNLLDSAHNTGITIRVYQNDGITGGLITRLAPILDQNVDGGDGSNCGQIKWGGNDYSLYYVMADDDGDL